MQRISLIKSLVDAYSCPLPHWNWNKIKQDMAWQLQLKLNSYILLHVSTAPPHFLYLKEIWEPLIHKCIYTQPHMICILKPVNFLNQHANINHVQAKMKVLFEKYNDCKSIKFCWKILHLSDSIRKR